MIHHIGFTKREIMNKTKEKYESLLLLNYKLCSSPENEINGVCDKLPEGTIIVKSRDQTE